MIKGLLALAAHLAQEQLRKVKILEQADGGGNKMIKKNADCIVNKGQKRRMIKGT